MLSKYINMDTIVESIMAGIIEFSRFVPRENWRKNNKLKILLVGYNGARNTGADVRVEAMVRQFYHILGTDNIQIGVLTLDASHSSIYFKPPTELIQFSSVFFKPLLEHCSRYHMAVLSEGSCFKSKFANALTTFFFGAAGIMKKQGKPCIAYGSEAGEMDEILKWFVKHYCDSTYVISRTEPSMNIAKQLGFKSILGTDTAWIFPPASKEIGEKILKDNGWDGLKPVIGAAVINPFYWPVKPDLIKFFNMKISGKKRDDNYDRWYFFSTSEERSRRFEDYITYIAKAMDHFSQKYNAFPVIIGMERLDRKPCEKLQEKMKIRAPIFSSEEYDGYKLVSILHHLSLLLTSRYHARVLSMTAGVPSCAISMDERLKNLLEETGHINDFYLDVNSTGWHDELIPVVEKLWYSRENVKNDLLGKIPDYLHRMALMGKEFKNFIRENFPEFPAPSDPVEEIDYLPPLHAHLLEIMKNYKFKNSHS